MEPNLAPDQNRRLESVLRFGTVSAVDTARAVCRATSGGLETDWLQWLEPHASDRVRDWNPPSVGEQCVVLSPSGETGAGAILTGLYQNACPAPESSQDVTARHWKDGAKNRYDQAAHAWLHELPAGGKLVLKVGGTTLEMTSDHILLTIGGTNMELTAQAATLTSPAVTVTAPPITLVGNVTIMGGLTGQPGPGGAGGSATFHGRIDADEDVKVTGAGVSLKDHVHSGVLVGGSNTQKPVGGG